MVWDALTNPSMTKQYMFGCETVSDWETGSELLWQGEYHYVAESARSQIGLLSPICFC